MIRVANAPCSWGSLEGREGSGIPYAQMLDELAETGYAGTELGDLGFLPTDPAVLEAELGSRNLVLLGAFEAVNLRSSDALRAALPRIRRITELLARVQDSARAPYFILADDNGREPERELHAGRISSAQGLDSSEWRVFAANAAEAARFVEGETGLATLFHPHCAGFVETPDETARLLDLTGSDLLNLVFDTGHYTYGTGQDDAGGQLALQGLERFFGRVSYVHFKDCDPQVARQARSQNWSYTRAVQEGIFSELGRGSVDFPAVLAYLRARGYADGITVEQDVLPGLGTPRESARRNRAYLRGIGL
jgi:inosose dehydratase